MLFYSYASLAVVCGCVAAHSPAGGSSPVQPQQGSTRQQSEGSGKGVPGDSAIYSAARDGQEKELGRLLGILGLAPHNSTVRTGEQRGQRSCTSHATKVLPTQPAFQQLQRESPGSADQGVANLNTNDIVSTVFATSTRLRMVTSTVVTTPEARPEAQGQQGFAVAQASSSSSSSEEVVTVRATRTRVRTVTTSQLPSSSTTVNAIPLSRGQQGLALAQTITENVVGNPSSSVTATASTRGADIAIPIRPSDQSASFASTLTVSVAAGRQAAPSFVASSGLSYNISLPTLGQQKSVITINVAGTSLSSVATSVAAVMTPGNLTVVIPTPAPTISIKLGGSGNAGLQLAATAVTNSVDSSAQSTMVSTTAFALAANSTATTPAMFTGKGCKQVAMMDWRALGLIGAIIFAFV